MGAIFIPEPLLPNYNKVGGIFAKAIWGFPKIRGAFLGVPIIRTVIYLGLYWGPLI